MSDIKIFVLNLDRSPDRFEYFKQFPEIERFSGIDAKSLDLGSDYIKTRIGKRVLDTITQNKTRIYPSDHNKGSIGCLLSHLACLRLFLERFSDHKYCLIFEDDIQIPDGWKQKLDLLLQEIPSDFGFCGVGFHRTRKLGLGSFPKIIKTKNYAFYRMAFYNANAVLYNRNFIQTILQKAFPSSFQYDWYLCKLALEHPKQGYHLHNKSSLFGLRTNFETTIHLVTNQKPPHWTKYFSDSPEFKQLSQGSQYVNWTLTWVLVIVLLVFFILFTMTIIIVSVKLSKKKLK